NESATPDRTLQPDACSVSKGTVPKPASMRACLAMLLLWGLGRSAPQARAQIQDGMTMDTLTAISLQEFLKFDYKPGSGKAISVADLKTYLSRQKLSISSLPADIVNGIKNGNLEVFLVPGVPNPSRPG